MFSCKHDTRTASRLRDITRVYIYLKYTSYMYIFVVYHIQGDSTFTTSEKLGTSLKNYIFYVFTFFANDNIHFSFHILSRILFEFFRCITFIYRTSN